MDLASIIKKYADEIGGSYSGYDHSHSVIIVPLTGGRFQTVMGAVSEDARMVSFASKVCPANSVSNFRELLEQSATFLFSRFVIREGFVQIEALAAMGSTGDESLKAMIQEVARLADQYEHSITGADVH